MPTHQVRKLGRLAPRWRSVAMVLGTIGALVVLGLIAPRLLAWAARQQAMRELRRGAISSAGHWLARADRLLPEDPRVSLLEAACFRHLRQARRFARALETAEQQGAPRELVAQERILGLIQAGRFDEVGSPQPAELIAQGFSPHEVAAAFVCGLLVRDQPEEAQKTLDAWAADFPEEPQVAYMRGVYCQWLDRVTAAEEHFRQALARQPRHELARMALAELLEQQDRFAEALEQYTQWAAEFPRSELARAGLARLLRSAGRLDEARQVAAGISATRVPAALALEIAQIELESGNVAEARQRLDEVDLADIEDREVLRSAATAFGLTDQHDRAEMLFAQADAAYGRVRRMGDLRARLAVDPADRAKREELARLVAQSQAGVSAAGAPPPSSGPLEVPRRPSANAPSQPYRRWCAACHGADGRGDGPAARHLFPRPRDFHSESFRLVSTANAVPTREDIQAAIRRGMPGTSMRAFDNLSDDQQKQLADEVLDWYRQGIREQLVAAVAAQHDEIGPDELEETLSLRTTPGQSIEVPSMGPADPAAVARGKKAYLALGCAKCHGEDGRGTGDVPLLDEKGNPCLPRDLVSDPFKGGGEPAAIFLRIRAGMPGTPHPGCLQVPPRQIVEVVQYCRAIAQEPKRALTNYQRMIEAAARQRIGQPATGDAGQTVRAQALCAAQVR